MAASMGAELTINSASPATEAFVNLSEWVLFGLENISSLVSLSLPSADTMALTRETLVHWPGDINGKPGPLLLGEVVLRDSIGHYMSAKLPEVQTITCSATDTVYKIIFVD